MLCGISAGMNCWFQASVTDSYGPELAGLPDGLGLLPGSACPHYDGEPERRPTYRRLVADGTLPGGWAADDGAALVFRGQRARRGGQLAPRGRRLPGRSHTGGRAPRGAPARATAPGIGR